MVVDATVVHLPEPFRSMVQIQRLTGCRPCEVCLLRPCDVDRSGDVWRFTPREHVDKTVVETCRQQHRNAFAFLTQAVAAHLGHQPAPSLLPGT